MQRLIALLVIGIAGLIGGCDQIRDHQTKQQLQRVAKDWCMTIRASQVIPVYPLTEDLQPGDVFLVQTPIQKQQDDYSKKGFLPLDQLLCRLEDLSYAQFYRDAYWKGDYGIIPHDRPVFEGGGKSAAAGGGGAAGGGAGVGAGAGACAAQGHPAESADALHVLVA
jgi:hypothetical protein